MFRKNTEVVTGCTMHILLSALQGFVYLCQIGYIQLVCLCVYVRVHDSVCSQVAVINLPPWWPLTGAQGDGWGGGGECVCVCV